MPWLAIFRAVLSLANSIAKIIQEKALMDAGEARGVAKSLAEMQRRLEIGDAVDAEVKALTDQEARDKLKKDAR